MKAIDQYTIQTIGIPSLVLMERAAAAVAEAAEEEAGSLLGCGQAASLGVSQAVSQPASLGTSQSVSQGAGQSVSQRVGQAASQADRDSISIWAVCGTGNNGADGVAAARMLHNKGYQVTVILAGDQTRVTEEFRIQRQIAERLNMQLVEWKDFLPGRCDILIDAVFGVGLTRDVEGEYREVVEMMNQARAKRVIAVDMPSGIHSDTGQIMGCAIKAHRTITFGYEKMGSVLYPGRLWCGRTKVCDIGFPPVSLAQAGDTACTYGPEDLERIPPRAEYGNKGTFGKVLVAAGSPDMGGAAYLSAKAAYGMGAGLVKVMTARENRQMIQELLPEAILCTYEMDLAQQDPESFHSMIERECAWADVIVLGPGIGQSVSAKQMVREFLMNAYVPVVLDADGLNVIASQPELTQYFTENIIITPHLGEMSRLTGKTVDQIQKSLVKTAQEYSTVYGIQCVLKDAATVVTGRDGQCYINSSGNSAMAKAGSGDVLTGTIAGLLALGMEPWDGAALGVYLHGIAGDRVQERKGPHGLLAGELAQEIGYLSRK